MEDNNFSMLLRKVTEESDAYNFYENSRRGLDWGDFASNDFVLHRSLGLSNYISVLFKSHRKLSICNDDLLFSDDSDVEAILEEYEIEHLGNAPKSSKQENWLGENKIYSIHGNRFGSDMRRELQHLYLLLGNGGSAAILFLLESSYFYFLHELYQHPVWGEYMKYKAEDIPSWLIWKQDKARYYKEMLKDIGFSIVCFRIQSQFKSFPSDEECIDWICSTIAFSENLKERMKLKFREEAFNIYLKYNKRLRDGLPSLYNTNLIALVKKPKREVLPENANHINGTADESNLSDYESFHWEENNSLLTVKEACNSEIDKAALLDSNSSKWDTFSNENTFFHEEPVYPFLRSPSVLLEPPSDLVSKH
ncbi:uncharacterized protein TNIN_478101 [Trichonephila inaurata madagascariensis]|uniref:Uncharacterized protein n=1 Tax=Trichonephila inaurata madagascariensis TaxID=2747483 RepID=A0A8X7CR69_9ARAC|nr:uncharacterized protein TNIN_478101 [Trichonephila inaurata madagascariensis]